MSALNWACSIKLDKSDVSDLVFTSHDDVFGFWHHAALLGHECVPLRPWQAVGGEETIILLHA